MICVNSDVIETRKHYLNVQAPVFHYETLKVALNVFA